MTLPRNTAVFTGTFDPFTLGHLDVVRRGASLFDHLVVAPFANVTVELYADLAVQFVRRLGARNILRGVRTLSDMEYEFSMTLTNARLDPEIETVFLMADGEHSHISSSLIKQIASLGGEGSLN